MAPVSPEYSKTAGTVRKGTEADLLKKENPCAGINQIFDTIHDLWDGILAENFVFNFKNNEYIKAYDSLEKKYKELWLGIHTDIMDWRKKSGPEINQLSDKTSLRKKFDELKNPFLAGGLSVPCVACSVSVLTSKLVQNKLHHLCP